MNPQTTPSFRPVVTPTRKGEGMLEAGFKSWLAGADTKTLVCWDLGHVWDEDMYDDIERVHGAYLMSGRCQRGCGVSKVRYMASDWSPDSNKNTYKYPVGYSPKTFISARDVGFRMTWEHKAAIRRELARRKQEEGKVRQKPTRPAKVTDIATKFSGLWRTGNAAQGSPVNVTPIACCRGS